MKAITWKWLSTFFPTFLRPWLLTCLGLEPHLLLSIKILVIRKTISMKQIPHVQEQEEVTWCQVRCVGWIGMAYTDSIEYWRWSYELQELVYCLEADEFSGQHTESSSLHVFPLCLMTLVEHGFEGMATRKVISEFIPWQFQKMVSMTFPTREYRFGLLRWRWIEILYFLFWILISVA